MVGFDGKVGVEDPACAVVALDVELEVVADQEDEVGGGEAEVDVALGGAVGGLGDEAHGGGGCEYDY